MMNLSRLNIKFVKNVAKLNVMRNTNIYKIAFFFDNEWWHTEITGNQIATHALSFSFGDSIFSLYDEQADDEFEFKFKSNDKKYKATFAIDDVTKINVYNDLGDDDYLETGNIPYIVLKVENSGNVIYNIGDEI